jgi:hypothetical protein
VVLEPAKVNYRCPKCGSPLEAYAPTKLRLAMLERKLPQKVVIYKGGKFLEYDKGDAILMLAGHPEYRSSMWLIANIMYVKWSTSPSVYTAVLYDIIDRHVDKIRPLVKRAKAKNKATLGMQIAFREYWAGLARILLDHAWAIVMINEGRWHGPPPILRGHIYIPPLVDQPEKALEDEIMQKVVKEFEKKYGMDIVKQWEYWIDKRNRIRELREQILKKLGD